MSAEIIHMDGIPRTIEDSRKLWAKLLADRAARFKKLVDLNAPEIIIERERKMIAEALFNYPAHIESQVSYRAHESENIAEREGFLFKHGFYPDIQP